MAGFTIDAVTLGVLNSVSNNLTIWQGLLKDGRKIKSIDVKVAIDAKDQPSYEITVEYYDAPTTTVNLSAPVSST